MWKGGVDRFPQPTGSCFQEEVSQKLLKILLCSAFYYRFSKHSLVELSELEIKHAKTQYEYLRQSLLALKEIA